MSNQSRGKTSFNRYLHLYLTLLLPIIFLSCAQKELRRSDFSKSLSTRPTRLPEYRLGFGDVIEVKFFNNDRFNEMITVRPDGRITMEKVGDIYVDGMTPSQLDSLITVTYADIIRNPEVTVFVRNFAGYSTYILGEVKSPGGYPIQRNMTIVQSLAAAGGTTNSANISSVMLLRQGKDGEVNALRIDIGDYLDGDMMHIFMQDKKLNVSMNEFFIQPQDIIYVPKSFFADATYFLTQVWAGLMPPVDAYLRALWWKRY